MNAYENQFMWYELATTDVAAAIGFYRGIVAWNTLDGDATTTPYTMWLAKDGPIGAVILMPEAAKANDAPPHWAAYVGVADVDAATQKAAGLGATIVVPATDIPNVGRYAVIFDPQGAAICLFHPAQDAPPTDDGNSLGHFVWHELMTSDQDAAWSFYSSMFGWQLGEAMDMGQMGTYQVFTTDPGQPAGGMMTRPEGMPGRPAWLYYVKVENLDTSLSMVMISGGTVINGPIEVPGGDHVAVCTDPQGAMFAMIQVGTPPETDPDAN